MFLFNIIISLATISKWPTAKSVEIIEIIEDGITSVEQCYDKSQTSNLVYVKIFTANGLTKALRKSKP